MRRQFNARSIGERIAGDEVAPESGRNRIMIYGPRNDGTYIVEFKTADGDVPSQQIREASMFSIVIALLGITLASPVALAGQLNLICRGQNVSLRALTAIYEKTTVLTPNGQKTVYAVTDVKYLRSFAPSRVPAGDKGQNLADRECGLATAILQGVSTTPDMLPTITFKGFQSYEGSVATNAADNGGTALNGEAILPTCSSNVYQFLAEQLSNSNMFEVVGDAAVKCVF